MNRHRRNRAHIQQQEHFTEEGNHLNVNRNWNHLLQSVGHEGTERPMAIVGGIGRTTTTTATGGAGNEENEGAENRGGIGHNLPASSILHETQQQQQQYQGEEEDLNFVRALAIPHCQHTDWDALRQFRISEMNEIRQRATHMENTMRWWLISAEQWREKWLTVKAERNRLREENCRLRKTLAKTNAELRTFRADGDKMKGSEVKMVESQSKNAIEIGIKVTDVVEVIEGKELLFLTAGRLERSKSF